MKRRLIATLHSLLLADRRAQRRKTQRQIFLGDHRRILCECGSFTVDKPSALSAVDLRDGLICIHIAALYNLDDANWSFEFTALGREMFAVRRVTKALARP